ncbi:ABC transporter ATP-binding protein [Dactylosporangium sp. NPDC051484]|uniref:ABC transporter ATP-binding protein n=1 Tax=Dactylosporangium sp. NPDC051484 TaxID=3154942 RepID=UPI00344F7FD6
MHYGKLAAVQGVSLRVEPGAVTLVIGVNGAGKSTTLRAIAGLHRPTRGVVTVEGKAITGRPAHDVVREGVVLVPEGRRIFAPLTVLENLRMGAYTAKRDQVAESIREIFELFPILQKRRSTPAGLLSGGEQQMLAFGRALAARPKYILLDEPSMGLAPAVFDTVLDSIGRMAATGIGIVMVEQNAEACLSLANDVVILAQGEVAFAGAAGALQSEHAFLRTLLGESAFSAAESERDG